nr:uncharacterized protein LOC111423974 [Onthophagus taurus]
MYFFEPPFIRMPETSKTHQSPGQIITSNKMKLILFFFAVVAAISAIPTANGDLQSDLEYIVSKIPLAEIRALARRYAATDAEFQEVVRYLQGPEFSSLVDAVAKHERWQKFKAHLADAGVDIDGVMQYIYDLLADVILPKNANQRNVKGFLDEVRAIIDVNAIADAIDEKKYSSADFGKCFYKISMAHWLWEGIWAMDEVKQIRGRLLELGINLDAVGGIQNYYWILEWEIIQSFS